MEICQKISDSRRQGKRNFMVLVSEGVGSEYAPALSKKIEQETGVDTKFARLAHVVRGGSPTLRDRVMASEMGVFAVNQLLDGKSNLVVCLRKGKLVATDINYALKLDLFYKGKITREAVVAEFGEETAEKMYNEAAARRERIEELYKVGKTISL